MRKIITLVLALGVMMLFSNGMAQEENKTIVTVGGSYWNATYSYQNEDGKDVYEFGTGNLFGPYLSISNGKWNFGSSMYFGTFPVEKMEAGNNLDVKRSDLNFTIGYRVHPNINVFGGVKYLKWTMSGEMEYWSDYYNSTVVDYEATESGPMFGAGVGGTVPLGTSGLYAFGSIAYLVGTMKTEVKAGDYTSDENDSQDIASKLAALNLGLGYRFPSGLGVNIGYRADLYTESQDVENYLGGTETVDYNLGVKGLVATVSYTFK